MVSSTALTASVAVFLSPRRSEIASIRSRLFIRFLRFRLARTKLGEAEAFTQIQTPQKKACRGLPDLRGHSLLTAGRAQCPRRRTPFYTVLAASNAYVSP